MAGQRAYPDGGGQRGERAATLGDAVLPDPLDHIAEEHLRLREICGWLDALVAAEPQRDPTRVSEALVHLKIVLPRHVRDEEGDLFPLLRRRSGGDDDIGDTLDRLTADHVSSRQARAPVIAALERIAATGDAALTAQEGAAVAAFAAHERRHLIVENAIVLPLARVRLTRSDLKSLRVRMIERRRADAQAER
ncbi:hemerythrin domain-containing protein [Antarcticimicrobium luteum]|uniref:Hemerythrin domain-containing protein n=1 Tax=Antarcticimicrobium luteum TaxID=2547397 RepID=A0A4V3AS94_9RHOB|nr:hemerythrin domain-containing protein [Antarcticimicrobium luteum]TDK49637.1 hemerythrin domain-containing protein [Antarcticimicrobium luteum]